MKQLPPAPGRAGGPQAGQPAGGRGVDGGVAPGVHCSPRKARFTRTRSPTSSVFFSRNPKSAQSWDYDGWKRSIFLSLPRSLPRLLSLSPDTAAALQVTHPSPETCERASQGLIVARRRGLRASLCSGNSRNGGQGIPPTSPLPGRGPWEASGSGSRPGS